MTAYVSITISKEYNYVSNSQENVLRDFWNYVPNTGKFVADINRHQTSLDYVANSNNNNESKHKNELPSSLENQDIIFSPFYFLSSDETRQKDLKRVDIIIKLEPEDIAIVSQIFLITHLRQQKKNQ